MIGEGLSTTSAFPEKGIQIKDEAGAILVKLGCSKVFVCKDEEELKES